nr:hypothetical protein [uncultured Desulfobacter sp.]
MKIVLFLLSSDEFLSAKEQKMYKNGVLELTEEELQWQNKHMRKMKKVEMDDVNHF